MKATHPTEACLRCKQHSLHKSGLCIACRRYTCDVCKVQRVWTRLELKVCTQCVKRKKAA